MTDHYDADIAQMERSLAEAKIEAETHWLYLATVDAIEDALADLRREAATWRALTPEQRVEIIAAREAKWAALEDTDDEDEDTDDEEDEDDD